MEPFVMEIAGLVTKVQPLFVSTRDYCRNYLTDKEPEFTVKVTSEDLIYEQKLADIEADEEGLRRRKFTDPFLERATIQRKIGLELIKRDVILLHGSTVAVDGYAYLFTAACGTGKSTHTRFWREMFGNRAIMVNDDKTFLQINSDGALAYGAPWSGKHGLDTNVCLPLKGICFLERGADNTIQPAGPAERMAELLHQTLLPEEIDLAKKAESLVGCLANTIPLWQMTCTKDPQAALVSHGAMSQGL